MIANTESFGSSTTTAKGSGRLKTQRREGVTIFPKVL